LCSVLQQQQPLQHALIAFICWLPFTNH
jgi:hypothetical protein